MNGGLAFLAAIFVQLIDLKKLSALMAFGLQSRVFGSRQSRPFNNCPEPVRDRLVTFVYRFGRFPQELGEDNFFLKDHLKKLRFILAQC